MTKIRKLLFGCIALGVFSALSVAQAQNPPAQAGPAPQWHAGQRIQEIYKQLNLTDEQKNALEANKAQHRVKMNKNRRQMKIYRDAFQEELMKPQMDMPTIMDIHNKIKALQSQMEDDNLSSILAVRSILTPEQFTEFATLMHRHKARQGHNEDSKQSM